MKYLNALDEILKIKKEYETMRFQYDKDVETYSQAQYYINR